MSAHRQPGRGRLRAAVLLTHRWLGLASAIVLSIAGVTGAALVWPEVDRALPGLRPLHQRLGAGAIGRAVVLTATAAAILIEAGGVVLWWRRRTFRVRARRGWHRTIVDLHHSAGAIGLLLMAAIAVTGIGLALPVGHAGARIFALHTARSFPFAVKVAYTIGALGFVIQSATGVLMWWTPRRVRA
jgi:uncharacterized iron-regulated membrane protein